MSRFSISKDKLKHLALVAKINAKRAFAKTFGGLLRLKLTSIILSILTKIKNICKTIFSFLFSALWLAVLFTHSKLSRIFTPLVQGFNDKVQPRLWSISSKLHEFKPSRLTMASACFTLVLAFYAVSICNVGLLVKVNGQVIGYVENEEQIEAVIAEIENKSSEVLGTPYTLDADIEYSLVFASDDEYLSHEETSIILSENVNDIANLAVVTIDGQVIGALSNSADAYNVIEQIKLDRVDGDTDAQIEFVQDIKVETMQTSVTMMITEDQLYERLNATSQGEHIYQVKSGDTISQIANDYEMNTSEVLALNPEVDSDKIKIGQELVVSAAVPTLSAKVTREIEYTETIPYETVKEDNDDMVLNSKKTVQQGSEGSATIEAQVVSIDGVEVERVITSRVVLEEPTTEIVEVGTKVVPHIGTGDFLRPFGGTMSSDYGWRSRGYHTGVDFAGPSGSTIVAADNGRVVFSGWYGGYGNCVIIDHGNGIETLYAHNTQNSVSVGQVVERGQKIATVGSTGNSTGPHLHFEVRVNGNHVNPWNYL